jgi:hypothetical protein
VYPALPTSFKLSRGMACRHRLHVTPCTESVAATGQHDASHIRIELGGCQLGADFFAA